jgi:hypothetical protein
MRIYPEDISKNRKADGNFCQFPLAPSGAGCCWSVSTVRYPPDEAFRCRLKTPKACRSMLIAAPFRTKPDNSAKLCL